jgi:hypothetical protein
LIDDKQRFRFLAVEIAPQCICALAGIGDIYAVAQLCLFGTTQPKKLCGVGDTVLQALNRVTARAHDDDMPDFIVRLVAALVGQCAAAKGWDEPRLCEGRFSCAAVSDDRDEHMLFEFLNEFADFALPSKKAVGLAFVHRAQANKGLVNQDDLAIPNPCRGLDQLCELARFIGWIEDALIAPGEGVRTRGV